MRSRNDSPGRAVICTTISSDRTRVPPVTAERSPPDSRITGADSPVMADSSTVAMPSTTSPSPGMTSPALTTQRSPTVNAVDGTSSMVPSGRRRRATVSCRVLRSVAAWALPRPSAMASAKLAKSTVNHSHAATPPAKTFSCAVASEVADEQDRRQHAADLDDEHDRVAGLDPRVELLEGVDDGGAHDGAVEQRAPRERVPVSGVLARRPLDGFGAGRRCSQSSGAPRSGPGRGRGRR